MNKDNKLILRKILLASNIKNLSNLNVSFNRIAFIFFAFLICIYLIFIKDYLFKQSRDKFKKKFIFKIGI